MTPPKGDRGNYAEKVPESLALKIVDNASKKHWFYIWLENKQKWSEVVATEEFRRTHTDEEEQVEAWLTEAQWEDLYKSALVASEIKKAKGVGPAGATWKPDPNVPHLVEAKLYRGTVAHTFKKKLEKITSKSIQFRAEVDASAGHALAEHLVGDAAGARLCSSPVRGPAPALGRHGGEPSSPEALSPRTAARLDREQKDKIKKEKQEQIKLEKKEAAELKKAKAQADREAWKLSPPGLAQKWLDGVGKDLNSAMATTNRLRGSDLSPGLMAEWRKVMEMHSSKLVQIRSEMEAVRGGDGGVPGESVPAKFFEAAKSCVDAFKKDQKDLNALLTMREKPARQPKTAQPAAA